jgi:catechol 2,3-dioxygenase-like lactoylglutathione lyase family enzyme
VADLERSIDFYETLGFAVEERYEQEGWLLWCRLRRGPAELMLALASEPVHDHAQGVLFYLYVDDLDALRATPGLDAGPVIEHEAPRPAREMRLQDPDGYVVMAAELA